MCGVQKGTGSRIKVVQYHLLIAMGIRQDSTYPNHQLVIDYDWLSPTPQRFDCCHSCPRNCMDLSIYDLVFEFLSHAQWIPLFWTWCPYLFLGLKPSPWILVKILRTYQSPCHMECGGPPKICAFDDLSLEGTASSNHGPLPCGHVWTWNISYTKMQCS